MSSPSYLWEDATPADIKNAKGLHLITQNTPNGQKVQIALEELARLYPNKNFSWGTTLINIFTNEQKKDWFLRLNPNGRIPVLVDKNQTSWGGQTGKEVEEGAFTVHETSAILLYLLEHYDEEGKLGFKGQGEELERSQLLQWLFFWHGSGAPYQGQTNHFRVYAKEKIPYAIERYSNETLRVYGVLEIHLSGKYTGEPREYLAGKGKGKYSVADIGTWPWVKGWEKSGFKKEELEPFPHLLKWIDRIWEREAVRVGTGDKYNPPKDEDKK